MHRLKFGFLLAALAALILTSIAVADENQPSSRTSVVAHFTATGTVKSTNCSSTANNSTMSGNIERRGQLAGTSTSADKRLSGPVRIGLRAVINRDGVGIVTGTFRVVGKVEADVLAVVSGTNRIDGFLRTRSGGRLFANFSATLGAGSATGSTLTGEIGSGSHLNTAVLGRGGC
jgi:hypothetical protein